MDEACQIFGGAITATGIGRRGAVQGRQVRRHVVVGEIMADLGVRQAFARAEREALTPGPGGLGLDGLADERGSEMLDDDVQYYE